MNPSDDKEYIRMLEREVKALKEEVEADMVNHPAHYKTGGIEAIDIMKAKLSPEEFRGYLIGNSLKYLMRLNHKGKALEDAKKAQWYINKLVATMEG